MGIYNVAIIGVGSIGALKDDKIDFPGSANILTHANAVDRHPGTELSAIIDNDDEQLRKAKAKWNPSTTVRKYEDISIHGGRRPDIAIVAVPTKYHFEVLLEILKRDQPRLIIAEKPFCQSYKEAKEIERISNQAETSILVDYIRRFPAKYQEIKRQIDSGLFGKTLNCRVLYTRGLKHEGCHAIDLMRYFFGECLFGYVESKDGIIDREESDPSISALFEFEKCSRVVFQPCDGRVYGIFEIDICFEKTRLRFIDNGLFVERYPINENNEWGQKSLDYSLVNVIRTETNLNTGLYNLMDNAVNFLDKEQDLICTADDAIKVHGMLENLR